MTKTDAGAVDQRERSRRWRAGVALRLDEIQRELEQLGTQIDAKLRALTDGSPSRSGRRAVGKSSGRGQEEEP